MRKAEDLVCMLGDYWVVESGGKSLDASTLEMIHGGCDTFDTRANAISYAQMYLAREELNKMYMSS